MVGVTIAGLSLQIEAVNIPLILVPARLCELFLTPVDRDAIYNYCWFRSRLERFREVSSDDTGIMLRFAIGARNGDSMLNAELDEVCCREWCSKTAITLDSKSDRPEPIETNGTSPLLRFLMAIHQRSDADKVLNNPIENLAPFASVVARVLSSRFPGFHPSLDDSEDRSERVAGIGPEFAQRVPIRVTRAFPDAADGCPIRQIVGRFEAIGG